MAFDIEGARAEGYSDAEIAEYLASQRKFDLAGARAEGYSDADIIAHLSSPEKSGKKAPSKAALAADKYKAGLAGTAGTAGSILDMLSVPGLGMAPTAPVELPEPRFGPQFQQATRGALGVQGYEPQSRGEQFIAAPAEMLGAATLPGAGVVGAVPRAAKIPAALFELASAMGGGLGEATGRVGGEITDWYAPETGALVGAVLGSLAPVPANIGMTMGARQAGRFLPGAQRRAAGGKVVREIQDLIGPKGRDSLDRALELAVQIPGFNPTLGQASGAPGLIAREQNLQHSTAEALERAAGRYDENVAALDAAMGARFPASDVSPVAPGGQALKAAEVKLSGKQAGTERAREALGERFERQPVGDFGASLRAKRNERMEAAKQIKNQKYADVYRAADEAGLRVEMDDVEAFVKGIVDENRNAFQDMPRTFQKVLSKGYGEQKSAILGPDGNPLPVPSDVRFETLHSLMREASREAQLATDPTKAYFLRQLSDMLYGKVRGYEASGFGDVATKLREANRFYNEGYRQVFKEGAGGRLDPVLAMGKFGEMTADEDIVRKLFFKSGGEQGVKDFFRIYGDDPEAMDLLRGGILDIFAKEAVKDGKIDPRAAQGFFRRYHHALERLPGVRQELSKASSANEALLARAETLHEQSKRVAKSILGKVTGSENPAEDVAKAMTSPKAMSALAGTARKVPGGSQALRRAVAEHVMAQPDPFAYLQANRNVIGRAIATHGADQAAHVGAKHMADLETLAEAQSMLRRNVPPTRLKETEAVKDPIQERFGSSLRSIAAHHRAVVQGRGSAQDALINTLGKYAFIVRERHAKRLFEEAIYDPKVARTLAAATREKTPSNGIRQRLAAHLLSLGVRLPAAQDQ